MIDNEKLTQYFNDIQEKANSFSEMTTQVVTAYSGDLDAIMEDLKIAVTQPEAISTDALERYYAELTNLIYFMADKVEKLNVYSDVSKASAKEAYNRSYLTVSTEKDEKGKSIRTVAENTALAESNSQYESTINTIYDHAYKTLRMKIDYALEMVSTLKHILKRRTQEEYVSFSMNNMKTFAPEEDDN